MSEITAGFALCGSFCTFSSVVPQMKALVEKGIQVVPIMSQTAHDTDTRFGKAADFIGEIEEICGQSVLYTQTAVEPIGPQNLLDILIIAPCTGNTLAKLANGITDTSVTLAAKAHIRNNKPVLIGISTNDALGTSALNIGRLLNTKNIYFIPMRQDDCEKKPKSVIADFSLTYEAMKSALDRQQLQPVLL